MKKTTDQRKSRKATGKWADVVRELREHLAHFMNEPVTQADFASFFDVAEVTVRRWESGRQDPPRPKLEHLLVAAHNLGRPDLAVALRSESDPDRSLDKRERSLVMLFTCLFQFRQVAGRQHAKAIHAAAQVVFDAAHHIVLDVQEGGVKQGAGEAFLLRRMESCLKEIYDWEQGIWGLLHRKANAPMYTAASTQKTPKEQRE